MEVVEVGEVYKGVEREEEGRKEGLEEKGDGRVTFSSVFEVGGGW